VTWKSIVPEIARRMDLTALDIESLRVLCVATVEMREAEAGGKIPPGVFRRWYALAVYCGRAAPIRVKTANRHVYMPIVDSPAAEPRTKRDSAAHQAAIQRVRDMLAGVKPTATAAVTPKIATRQTLTSD
jgi:hypothetical protein